MRGPVHTAAGDHDRAIADYEASIAQQAQGDG